jgi:GT2 family glycosyltransferase
VPTNKIKIATLSCSFNRVNKTAKFLKTLTDQQLSTRYSIDYYLLDDNSSDGTDSYVRANFPEVTVINGSGALFWAGGMRMLWGEVLTRDNYDFFLLLNDDVVLADDALDRLFAAYDLTKAPGNILLGTVLDPKDNSISYGGHKMNNRLTGYSFMQEPDPVHLKACEIGNANIMLVDKSTVDKIGILSKLYTHGLADFDYSFTAVKQGLHVWLAPGYYGYCENDHGVNWLPKEASLKKRIAYLYSPKGLAYKEYLTYVKQHFPLMLPGVFFKAWLKTLFPFVYESFKKN